MPSAEDGEWSNWCSNVVCVRTKSSKEPENSSGGQVIHVQPIVVRSTYREEPLPPRTVHQRRRITRLIQSPPLSSTSPIQYEGFGRVSLNLKANPSVSSSTYSNGPSSWSSSVEYSRPPLFPPRWRSPVRVVLRRPVEHEYRLDHLIPDTSSSSSYLLHGSGQRDLRPSFALPSSSSYVRASSLPPSLSTWHMRRPSFAVPSYLGADTSGYGGRSNVANTRGVTSSLRRGSVDVSYLSSGPHDISKSSSYSRHTAPPVRSEVGLRSNYRRGSLSIPRPTTYRSSSVGRFTEAELKTYVPLSSTSETFSSLRTRTQKAKDKLDTQRSLLDRYLPGGSREPSIDNRFDLKDTSASRRSSISTLTRPLTGSRASSMERSNDQRSASALHRTLPPPSTTNNMSPARRRIRDVLFKVSGDDEFLN